MITTGMIADSGAWIAILIGVVGSAVIHLSQGILRLSFFRRAAGRAMEARRLFILGTVLNLSAPLWVVVANRFAPTVFYTSVYATGLLVLLVFSCRKLGHCPGRRDYLGAFLLIAGVALLARHILAVPPPAMNTVNPAGILVAAGVGLGVVWVAIRAGLRGGWLLGGLGGFYLAVDSLLKGIAQFDGEAPAFLPSTGFGIFLFATSFLGAGLAFGMTQLAHHRGARASETIAAYDAAYVAFPVLWFCCVAGQQGVSVALLLGLAALLLGVALLAAADISGHPSAGE